MFVFKFSPEFDDQKKQVFLNNFKSDKFFRSFEYLEENQSFSIIHYNEESNPIDDPLSTNINDNVMDYRK